MNHSHEHRIYGIGITLLVIVAVLIYSSLFFATWILSQPKPGQRCSDFGSYDDILFSFNYGNYRLDGDLDGIPCEVQKPQ